MVRFALIVSNYEKNRLDWDSFLRELEGMATKSVKNWEEAVKDIIEDGNSYDLVIMDMQMPNALKAIGKIREKDARCMIVGVIGLDEKGKTRKIPGLDTCVEKPLDYNKFKNEIISKLVEKLRIPTAPH